MIAPFRARSRPFRPAPALAAVLAVAVWAIAACAQAAAGAASGPAAADGVERGRLLYRIHCASCHGDGGRGDGPVAAALKDRPSDLTLIAERHGGEFPAAEVRRAVDGRQPIRAHGESAMPVWGLTFQDPGRDADQEAEVGARIEALVAYLASIQRREGPEAED